MRFLDDLLFDKFFDPIHKKFQILTGKTCFYLAFIFFIMAGSVNCVFSICLYCIGTLKTHEFLVSMIVGAFMFTLFFNLGKRVKRLEAEFLSKTCDKMTMNPRRITHLFPRMAMLSYPVLWSILTTGFFTRQIDFATIEVVLLSSFATCGIYFLCCTPIPRGESKIGEFIKSFKERFKVLTPSPVPSKI